MSSSRKTNDPPCPCGNNLRLSACCGAIISGAHTATSAEALMRSRYTAYALGDADYLLKSWHPDTRPERLERDALIHSRWIGLAVKRHACEDASHATVEFVARYKVGGRAHRLHETSRFVREDGQWLYVDGDLHDT